MHAESALRGIPEGVRLDRDPQAIRRARVAVVRHAPPQGDTATETVGSDPRGPPPGPAPPPDWRRGWGWQESAAETPPPQGRPPRAGGPHPRARRPLSASRYESGSSA